ncbi:hypothetical protein [Tepidibacter formicigenes]|jgi:cell division protein FtsL|uniref:Uncharacterized protein n=1 Tax=Tepidibacter formicigenes DSM 15518 TaxID=1123349 RepID=A0A1M6QIF9_9FIRM|nr:hypothetical protein [Tepidibacter formicigenes]SHK19986.1 hypothetical protein SAMN02744037_01856 [Tepidibacter formicigenes DSM 15518]
MKEIFKIVLVPLLIFIGSEKLGKSFINFIGHRLNRYFTNPHSLGGRIVTQINNKPKLKDVLSFLLFVFLIIAVFWVYCTPDKELQYQKEIKILEKQLQNEKYKNQEIKIKYNKEIFDLKNQLTEQKSQIEILKLKESIKNNHTKESN